jgi:peptidoglycan hydrolase CwlO-like protein
MNDKALTGRDIIEIIVKIISVMVIPVMVWVYSVSSNLTLLERDINILQRDVDRENKNIYKILDGDDDLIQKVNQNAISIIRIDAKLDTLKEDIVELKRIINSR